MYPFMYPFSIQRRVCAVFCAGLLLGFTLLPPAVAQSTPATNQANPAPAAAKDLRKVLESSIIYGRYRDAKATDYIEVACWASSCTAPRLRLTLTPQSRIVVNGKVVATEQFQPRYNEAATIIFYYRNSKTLERLEVVR